MNYDEMMAELQIEYISSLPQKIQDIETHLATRDRGQLRDDYHKLKGTGKTYGIPEISEFGELFEKLCLKKTISLDQFVPLSLTLLKQIYGARKDNKVYALSQASEFLNACRLIS